MDAEAASVGSRALHGGLPTEHTETEGCRRLDRMGSRQGAKPQRLRPEGGAPREIGKPQRWAAVSGAEASSLGVLEQARQFVALLVWGPEAALDGGAVAEILKRACIVPARQG